VSRIMPCLFSLRTSPPLCPLVYPPP
jgi:hypothetical protein